MKNLIMQILKSILIKCNDFNPLIKKLIFNIEFTIYRNSHIYI